jgi:hypothetical protein
MTITQDQFKVTKANAGAVWSATAAYSLQDDPRYAELERKLGVNAAKSIAITSAGNFWNADIAFSSDRLRDTDVSLDDSRATAARLSVYNAVDAVARDRGIGPDAIGRIADSFYAQLSNFQRASLGNNPGGIPGQADLSAEIVREVNKATAKTDTVGLLLDAGAKALAVGLSAIRMGDAMQDRNSSGSRYDQMPSSATTSGTSYYNTPAGMNEMRQLAVSSGVPWVANNPELLRLGPQAIKDIAQTGITQKNFQDLRDAGMTTKKAANFVGAVNDMNLPTKKDNQDITDNYAKVYKNADDTNKTRLDNSIQDYRDAVKQHKGDPDHPAVRKALKKIVDNAKDSAAKTPDRDDDNAAKKIADDLVKAGKIGTEVDARVSTKTDNLVDGI